MATAAELCLELCVPMRAEFISVARLVVASAALRLGYDVQVLDDIKVAVGEACGDAIAHGDATGGMMTIRCTVEADAFAVAVLAPWCPPASPSGPARHQGPFPSEHALGLLIVELLMDGVEHQCTPKTGYRLQMRRALPTPVAAPPLVEVSKAA